MEGIDHVVSGGVGGIGGIIVALFHKFMADRKLERQDQKNDETNKRIDETNQRVANAELYSARNYVTQEVLKNSLTPMAETLERMETKIDNLHQTKADKV